MRLLMTMNDPTPHPYDSARQRMAAGSVGGRSTRRKMPLGSHWKPHASAGVLTGPLHDCVQGIGNQRRARDAPAFGEAVGALKQSGFDAGGNDLVPTPDDWPAELAFGLGPRRTLAGRKWLTGRGRGDGFAIGVDFGFIVIA